MFISINPTPTIGITLVLRSRFRLISINYYEVFLIELRFQGFHIQDWSKNKWIGGAYSYALVGQGPNKRKIAATPLNDKVFFAGEAMNINGHHQSVHGAMETGRNIIQLILE